MNLKILVRFDDICPTMNFVEFGKATVMMDKYGVKPLKEPLEKKCVRPFREMIILYDGEVVLCCADSGNDFKLGNLNRHSFKQIWFKNRKLIIARLLLFNKFRIFPPCNRCDFNGGMRQGLIPKMKTITLEQAKEYAKEVISLK